MNTIKVVSVTHIEVNGINAGRVCDVISNYPGDLVPIQAGLEQYELGLTSAYESKFSEASKIAHETSVRAESAEKQVGELTTALAESEAVVAELSRRLSLPERERQAEILHAQARQLTDQAAALLA